MIASLVLLLLALLAAWACCRPSLLDPLGLWLIGITVFYAVRAVFVVTELDSLFAREFFLYGHQNAVTRANLLLALWVAAATLPAWVQQRLSTRRSLLFPTTRRALNLDALYRLGIVAASAWLGVTAVRLASYGDLGAMLRALKVDKELDNARILGAVGVFAVLLSVVGVLEVTRRLRGAGAVPGRRQLVRRRRVFALLALLSATAAFAWGSRTPLVATTIILTLGLVAIGRPARRRSESRARYVRYGALLVIALPALVFGLRVLRDSLVVGESLAPIASDNSLVRRLTVAGNLQQYDSFVLASRDAGRVFPLRHSADFENGIASAVPLASAVVETDGSGPIGQWFRQIYEPTTTNGWPVGAPGDWYIALDVWGVLIGGALSGYLIGKAQRSLTDYRSNAVSLTTGLLASLLVLRTGVSALVTGILDRVALAGRDHLQTGARQVNRSRTSRILAS